LATYHTPIFKGSERESLKDFQEWDFDARQQWRSNGFGFEPGCAGGLVDPGVALFGVEEPDFSSAIG
jgi:hypothetical protein